MTHEPQRQRRRRTLALASAVVVGIILFILGLDRFEMWLIVLVSYYVYWILRMD